VTQLGAVDLARTYDRRFMAVREYRQRVWDVLIRRFFQRLVPMHGTVLDLGCGWGEFVGQIRAGRKFAMDLNPAAGARLSEDVTFLHQDCSARWPMDDGSIDVVFTSNFFEHLPHKSAVQATVLEAFRTLKQGGRLICLGPNVKYLPGRYWDFWDHFVPLTELSLRELLELSGFHIELCLPRFLPYSMATGFRPPVWTVFLYLRLPWLWRLFGKQFLVVAVKP
jgi:SAM-dependent methyltransferase